MNTPVKFEIAKLLKEKGFDEQCLNFYTKPNSKMFGIDEHYRTYPIKNISKKLYKIGVHAVLNIENIYYAPTIAEIVMWLYEKHGIWLEVSCHTVLDEKDDDVEVDVFYFVARKLKPVIILYSGDFVNLPTKAYEAAIEYTLNNLIK